MTDLHTHILPGIDDGAKTPEISLAMLKRQVEQGIDTVVLTPHCYRDKEDPAHFLQRRAQAYQRLRDALEEQQAPAPRLLLAAEVAWVPNMAKWPELPQLCIEGTQNLLLEMPFTPWQDSTIDQIYDLMDNRGITPIFAHLERYLKDQRRDHIEEIIGMGTPIQLSCAPLLSFWDRRPLVKMIKNGCGHLLASDCHNLTTRQPNLKAGLDAVSRLLGQDVAEHLSDTADRLVMA